MLQRGIGECGRGGGAEASPVSSQESLPAPELKALSYLAVVLHILGYEDVEVILQCKKNGWEKHPMIFFLSFCNKLGLRLEELKV
jgi:hypothetical protein